MYSPHVLHRLCSSKQISFTASKTANTYMENGAIKRTTCCEFLGCLRRGMRDGSKSGGTYLLRTAKRILCQYVGDGLDRRTHLCVRTWCGSVVDSGGREVARGSDGQRQAPSGADKWERTTTYGRLLPPPPTTTNGCYECRRADTDTPRIAVLCTPRRQGIPSQTAHSHP